MNRQLTLRDLAIRLATVARTVGEASADIPLFICIAGDRMSLMSNTFQVDDDATLLVQVPQLQEMEAALQRSDERYNQAMLQLHNLTSTPNRLCADIAVMCEAQLAGDVVLVMSKVEQFTQAYQRNRQSVGAVH